MSSRRLERIAKLIQSTTGDVIQNRLADPRVQGMVSITRVEVAADLRRARVHLSILGLDEKRQQLCLKGIQHAGGYIQSRLAHQLTTKTCPTLSFFLDSSLKEGFKVMQLIDQAAAEIAAREHRPAAPDDPAPDPVPAPPRPEPT